MSTQPPNPGKGQKTPPFVDAPVTRAYLEKIDFEAMLKEDWEQMETERQDAQRARRRIAERHGQAPGTDSAATP